MKKRLMPLALAVATLMTSSPVMAGDFSQTCGNISIRGGKLTATCLTRNQSERNTAINLDRFIGNIDGELTWGDQNFSHSCRRISVDGNILEAICRTMDGRELRTGLNLDGAISNIDGKLMYDN